jgi:methyltransferase-like protein/SAM-dependent methyltransferase
VSSAAPSSYDELPYTDQPYYYTHPDALATVATLRGMSPPPVERCRVLELGCGAGGNLVGMALSLPDSRFLGVDLSPRQIEAGRKIVDALRLTNIDLRPLSILDVDASFGQFDYIICHGVYSWAPPAVQDGILRICGENLAPQGVAYVSYNTYPGWHGRGAIREMLCFHARRFGSPDEKVRESRKFLDFLEQSIPNRDGFYLRLVRHEVEMLRSVADTYVFHEHLEEINRPSYFHEFAACAAARGLQYLGEPRSDPVVANLAAEVIEAVDLCSADPIEREQYFDFICNRTFRRSLLCRREARVEPAIDLRRLANLYVTGLVKPETAEVDVRSSAVCKFQNQTGMTLSTNNPLVKTALVALAEAYPRAIHFEDLWTAIARRLAVAEGAAADGPFADGGATDGSFTRETLAGALASCYRSNLVELHVHSAAFVCEPSERPCGSPLARLQAASVEVVTNLRHRSVRLGDIDRVVLEKLDGAHDRAALLAMLTGLVERGDLEIQHDGQQVLDPREKENALRAVLERSLENLGSSALLLR